MGHESGETETRGQPVPRKRSALLQWNLQTLLLLTAALAVWIGYARYRQQNLQLRRQVESMYQMAAELRITDPKQIAVARLPEMWYDELCWDIHLPDGQYVMYLETRDIDSVVREEAPIRPGRHRIELEQGKDRGRPEFTVFVDDQVAIETAEISFWYPPSGSMGGGNFDTCTQVSPDRPVILFRRQLAQLQEDGSYSTENAPDGSKLWIERVSPAGSR